MIGRKKHILIVAAGLFLFPLLYQSFHLFHHQSSACESGHSCEASAIDNNAAHGIIAIDNSNDTDCLVCDYEFVLVKLYDQATLVISDNSSADEIIIPKYKLDKQELFSSKSPRAPPIQNFLSIDIVII